MNVLGIDLAAGHQKTFACALKDVNSTLQVVLHPACDDDRLHELAKGRQKVAIDAPFGWPNAFVDALIAHRSHKPWPAPDTETPESFRSSLSFRATDRVVMHTRRPLSVSTDKLGVTAMRCALLLHRWSSGAGIDRTGGGRFVEVYPAGALARWGLDPSGYKGVQKDKLVGLLRQLQTALPGLEMSDADRRTCATVDHAFDALVAALVARAAVLGLTDGPPPERREQAAQEGWIHLPLRGSLPFVGRSKRALRARPDHALSAGLAAAGAKLDEQGYAKSIDAVLLPSLSAESRAAIAEEVSGGAGSELVARGAGRPKFCAAYSSAALAANTFGPFLGAEVAITIAGTPFSGRAHLEVGCPTGLGGVPPTLDYLLEGPNVVAVESKCTETFAGHKARFSEAYASAMAPMHKAWQAEYLRLVEDPLRYRYLDAAQLIKHYLGLRVTYPDRPVTLVYLYWTPRDARDLAQCAVHAAEVAEFQHRVAGDSQVALVPLSYGELWEEWSSAGSPKWRRDHVAALKRRYNVAVGKSD